MMTPRTRGGALARALILSSAIGLATGAAMLAGCAIAQEAPAAAATRFQSDRMSVEVMGAGPDVILIPGFASSREVWRPTAERLAKTHRVHLVQLAGFAGEPWRHADGPFVQPVIDALADYVKDLERPAIIGHSMGGLSGLMLAQQHPERVGKVLSVDSLPFFSALYGPQLTAESARPVAEQTATMLRTAEAAAFRAMQTASAEGLAIDPAMRAAMVEWSIASDRQALGAAIRDVMTTDLRPGLAAMTTPVWAIYAADENGGAPAAQADEIWKRDYAALPGVTLIRVDGSRHFIMADQPARFAEIVDAFLN